MSIVTEAKLPPPHVIRLQGLDASRSKRIYKTLSDLSAEAVAALKNKDMKGFSLFTDKMRPLLSYITTNLVKLSDHFNEETAKSKTNNSSDYDLLRSTKNLRQNLRIIEDAIKPISSLPFTPAIFASEEVTNAYLDFLLPLSWDFNYDALILINLTDPRMLDYVTDRGQKRLFIIGGSLTKEIFDERLDKRDVTYWFYPDGSEIKELIRSVTGRPPSKIVTIDCGHEKIDVETAKKMEEEASLGRTACWQRFNTVNRSDTSGILDNLYSLATLRQTSEFHGKFSGIPGVVVCPGPSLEKNIDLLREIKGRALMICVLHALTYLQEKNITPDIVIQVDPKDLKKDYVEKNGQPSDVWEEWIVKNDLSKIKYFITSAYAQPSIFEIPVQNIFWMNAGLPIGKYIPINITDYKRVGGSVAHSAFDILVEFGCGPIALVGQDLAYSKEGNAYSVGSAGELGRKKGDAFMQNNYGNDVEVKGHDGAPVITSEVFLAFANLFTIFAERLQESKIKLFNCTEGGMYIDGFTHCKLEEFINEECKESLENKIDEIFSTQGIGEQEIKDRQNKINKFIGKCINLTDEIRSLLIKTKAVLEKKLKTDDDIHKFNKFQNKIIRSMGKNYFYSLALQKNIHILDAGLKADSSIEGQLGFHEDFLDQVEVVNDHFKDSLSRQKILFKKII